MNDIRSKMESLIDNYVSLEKEIQQLIHRAFHRHCEKCASRCCREEMCRESMGSAFLAMIVKKQGVRYDNQTGWTGPSGCRLAYGRPLVCYEFFCDHILQRQSCRDKKIAEMIHDFAAIGDRAHGRKHLMCIEDLGIISPAKIEKMVSKIGLVMSGLTDFKSKEMSDE